MRDRESFPTRARRLVLVAAASLPLLILATPAGAQEIPEEAVAVTTAEALEIVAEPLSAPAEESAAAEAPAPVEAIASIDSGDTAWLMTSSALVLLRQSVNDQVVQKGPGICRHHPRLTSVEEEGEPSGWSTDRLAITRLWQTRHGISDRLWFSFGLLASVRGARLTLMTTELE